MYISDDKTKYMISPSQKKNAHTNIYARKFIEHENIYSIQLSWSHETIGSVRDTNHKCTRYKQCLDLFPNDTFGNRNHNRSRKNLEPDYV